MKRWLRIVHSRLAQVVRVLQEGTICYFSDSESNRDPSISAGVGFSWSWLGALASAGPSLSAGITNALFAL